MIGITAHAVYIPRHRIGREMIASAFGRRALPGERTAVNFDEDSLTLATHAVQWGLRHVSSCHGLYFASTTAPYWEKLNAGLIAAACDLDEEVTVADFGGSVRSGTIALGCALDRVAASDLTNIIVAAADVRDAPPESVEEQIFGDAGAAIVIGHDPVIARYLGRATVYDDFLDIVRRDRDERVTSFASKFTFRRGYEEAVTKALSRLLEKVGLRPEEINKLILPPIDQGSHVKLSARVGFRPEQVQRTFFEHIGVTGSSMSLLLLSAALEEAHPNDKLLLVGYGDGADALLFEVTDHIDQFQVDHPIEEQLSWAIRFKSYELFRKAREFFRHHEDNLEISNILYEREERQNIRLYGTQCEECGTRQFPMTRVCIACRSTESLRDVRLGRRGRVFTFTTDTLTPSPIPPTVMAVVDLDDGGRLYLQMTDIEPESIRIGMPVELTLRRLKEGGGLHHYYWKCRPEER
ncbi:MAG: hydroxymethylglutaryl-CoA synthase family protein [Acidobacteria bacterium]|nr:MAG: hydroxymethylglutaryl-CoA synthase family protein [Acidobacteriota bacterium]